VARKLSSTTARNWRRMEGSLLLRFWERRSCCLVNVRLPLEASPTKKDGVDSVNPEHAFKAASWIEKQLFENYDTFLPIYFLRGQWWTRLSGQVYLELSDFEWVGHKLKAICEKAGKKSFTKE
jgi:hypothetical protein